MHTRLVASIIAAFAISNVVVSAEQQRPLFEVPAKDSGKAEELANQLARLSHRVDPTEAKLLADFAYTTVARLMILRLDVAFRVIRQKRWRFV